MEMIENQLDDVYWFIKIKVISVKSSVKKAGCEDSMTIIKNTIMHGMKIIMSNKFNENYSLTIDSVCEAYIEANRTDSDLIIPTYEECLKVYESKFMELQWR